MGSIMDVPGIGVGHATDEDSMTGCTVVVAPGGAAAGVDVRGSAPGTRETDVLHPINLVQQAHAICLSGGSAFGLAAANGVMRFLAEQGIGLDVGVGVVPIVPAAVLFDLAVTSPSHPTEAMGYYAAEIAMERAHAESPDALEEGNVGAGCGATVGKVLGMAHAMKSGIGSASRTLANGLVIGAVVAVNAVGDVMHPKTGQQLAGPRDENNELLDTVECLVAREDVSARPGTNTTIAVVASNANLSKLQATKVAQMAHDGLARTIRPIHTMFDGDTIFALATGGIDTSVDLVGALSADVLTEAILNAITTARGIPGIPAYHDLISPISH